MSSDSLRNMDLSSAVALVTGGGRGLGQAMAFALANVGAAVVLTGRTLAQLMETQRSIEARGGRAVAIAGDVTSRAEVERLFAHAEAQLGPVTVLVNNAGLLPPIAALWETDPEEWWRCVEVNVRGTYLCTWRVLPGMLARRHGRIITVVSVAAFRPITTATAYASSKAALVRFTDTLAAETRSHDVQVFAVDPGNVHTAMHEYLEQSPTWLAAHGGRHAPTYVPPERVAQLVVRLAAGHAAALTGRVITVHDDLDALCARADEITQQDLHQLRLHKVQ